jgi:glycosyltransferase involved in cell wall biosynthesis
LPSLWFDGALFSYVVKTVDRIETWAIEGIVCNSELTAKRCIAQYSRKPDMIINPPVDVKRFNADRERRPGSVVMVGRLEARKRVELAVKAFDGISEVNGKIPQLHLIGAGPLRSEIENNKSPNVHVHGYVSDDRLTEFVETAAAGLFLSDREDFGITPVEYMAAGTPVVGVNEPNTNNQVKDGRTGVLVETDPVSVRSGVRSVLEQRWDRTVLREAAMAYDSETFRTAIAELF